MMCETRLRVSMVASEREALKALEQPVFFSLAAASFEVAHGASVSQKLKMDAERWRQTTELPLILLKFQICMMSALKSTIRILECSD
jgi:hypothetical protein